MTNGDSVERAVGGGGGPVLVVEDEADLRALLVMTLKQDGFEVYEAGDGEVALEIAKRVAPRLIVLDMRLPVLDGWGFARAYRAQPGPHAPLLVLTAAHDPAAWAEEVAAEVWFAKPFDVSRLLVVVRHLAGRGAVRNGAGEEMGVPEGVPEDLAPFLEDLGAVLRERQELVGRISAAGKEPKELSARLERNVKHGNALLSQIRAVFPPEEARVGG